MQGHDVHLSPLLTNISILYPTSAPHMTSYPMAEVYCHWKYKDAKIMMMAESVIVGLILSSTEWVTSFSYL